MSNGPDNSNTKVQIKIDDLVREHSYTSSICDYEQKIRFDFSEFSILFNMSGYCSWGAQPHGYCEDARFFDYIINKIFLRKYDKDIAVNKSFVDKLEKILYQCVFVTDDINTAEDDTNFTGQIKLNYECTQETQTKISALVALSNNS